MMLSVMLLSVLMMLLSFLNVMRHLICSNSWKWLLGQSLICEILDWGRKQLFDSIAGKTQLVSFDWSNSSGANGVRVDGSVLGVESSFKMVGLTFSFRLGGDSCIISVADMASGKTGALIRSVGIISPGIALCLYESTIRPCMEYCCHVQAYAPGSVILLRTFH